MANSKKMDKNTRDELLKRYENDPDLLIVQKKYSKKSLNPIKNYKNKKLEKVEIDDLLLKKERKRKEEEKRILKEQKEQRKRELKEQRIANFKKHWLLYTGLCILAIVLFVAVGIIDNYKKTVREINFVYTPEVQYVGDKIEVNFGVVPDTAEYLTNEITISYSDKKLINSENTLLKEGTLTAIINYHNKEYDRKTIKIEPIKVTNIVQKDIEVGIGNTIKINPIIEPENATYKEYSLYGYDENIISVNNNEIIGMELGTTKLTFKTNDDYTKTIDVNVIEIEATEIAITGINDTYETNEADTVVIQYKPSETTNREVKFSSTNKNVLTIDDEGNIKTIGVGEATIIAEYNENIRAEKTVRVVYPPCESVQLSANAYSLYVGYKTNLHCSFTPKNNSDKDSLEYSSSDESILTVNEQGVVTAKSIGKATITVYCGLCTDSVEIEVIEKSAPAPASNPSEGNSTSSGSTHVEGDGTIAYITPYGKVYHKDPSCPASDNVSGVPIEQVQNIMRKCKKCWN